VRDPIVRPALLLPIFVSAWIACVGMPLRALAQEEAGEALADSAYETTYTTSYDRDRTRDVWNQTLSYGLDRGRTLFNIQGHTGTLSFLRSPSKFTNGNINGSLSYGIAGTWQVYLGGRYDMNSSTGTNDIETRDNHLTLQTQYLFDPLPGMKTILKAYTEFQRKQDRTVVEATIPGDPFEPTSVDSTFAQRDSSFTTSRRDGAYGNFTWPVRRWLGWSATASAYRESPKITSVHRAFINPVGSDSGGRVEESILPTKNPSNNIDIYSTVTWIPRPTTKLAAYWQRQSLQQSYFDKSRADQERSTTNRTIGNLVFNAVGPPGLVIHAEGGLTKSLNLFALNRTRTTKVLSRNLLSVLTYNKARGFGNVSYTDTRTVTDLQPSVNGVEVIRNVSGNGWIRTGKRFVLDGSGSVTLTSNDYENDRIDRDMLRTYFNVGGGYLLTPACTTSVHFSAIRSHAVALDPSTSAANAVTSTYQMVATLVYLPTPDLSVRQNYILSAEYRIFDYVESQNSLLRSRRIDTDIADTLFHFGFVRLTHNFVFQDQGTYARFNGDAERRYRAGTRSYDQTLTATAGLMLAPGVTFVATQSLLNRRSESLATGARTLQNQWKLNVGLQVFRTLPDGFQINGAVRRIGEYVEGRVNSHDTTRDDWVAGVTISRYF